MYGVCVYSCDNFRSQPPPLKVDILAHPDSSRFTAFGPKAALSTHMWRFQILHLAATFVRRLQPPSPPVRYTDTTASGLSCT